MSKPVLEIGLNTTERLETCLKTLIMCANMASDLANMSMAEEITGAVALKAFASCLNEMIDTVVENEPQMH